MAKISVIIPIYNVEKYLRHCVDCVLSQTFTDLQVLLVDDGSTDSSGVICDEYAERDSRILVFHKDNGGVSSARNIGLDNADGKYIIFLDADDFWNKDTALERLFDIAEKNDLDIVRGEYKIVDQDGNELFKHSVKNLKDEYSYKIISSGLFYTQIMCGENFLFLSLIKKEKIDSLRFNVEHVFLEDMEFYVYLLLQPLRCMYIPLDFYAYRMLKTSSSHCPKIKNLADSFSMCDIFYQSSKMTSDDVLRDAFRHNSIMMYYWTLGTVSSDPYYKNKINIISVLSLKCRQRQVAEWAKNENVIYPVIIYINPLIGVYIFRCIDIVRKSLYFFKKKIKKLQSLYKE